MALTAAAAVVWAAAMYFCCTWELQLEQTMPAYYATLDL